MGLHHSSDYQTSFESIGLLVQEKKFNIQSLIYKSSRYFLLSFESAGISVQEKKSKIYFQDWGHAGHLEFLI